MPRYVRDFDELGKDDTAIAGGKGPTSPNTWSAGNHIDLDQPRRDRRGAIGDRVRRTTAAAAVGH